MNIINIKQSKPDSNIQGTKIFTCLLCNNNFKAVLRKNDESFAHCPHCKYAKYYIRNSIDNYLTKILISYKSFNVHFDQNLNFSIYKDLENPIISNQTFVPNITYYLNKIDNLIPFI